MSKNNLYHGTFNWYGEIWSDYTRAASAEQAFRLLTARLGAEKGRTAYDVRQRFSKGDRYKIVLVPENPSIPRPNSKDCPFVSDCAETGKKTCKGCLRLKKAQEKWDREYL